MVKQKITRDDGKVYSGKGWVSNGHWLYPVGSVTLSRKDLQALIDIAVPFVWTKGVRMGELETGSDATIPDFEGVLPTDFRSRNGACPILPFTIDHAGAGLIPVSTEAGVAFFNSEYVRPLVAAGATIHPAAEDPEKSAAVVIFPNDERGVLMPVNTTDAKSIMESARTLVDGLAKRDG